MAKRKILFVINSLHTGGAERVLDRLLRAIGDRAARYDVHVALLDDDPQMRALPSYATVHVLDGRKRLFRSYFQLRRLARALNPAVAVSFLVRANVCTAVVMHGLPGRAVACERMHLGSHLAGRYRGAKLRLLRLLPRFAYPLADRILAVSNGVRDNLIEEFGLSPTRVRTIFNPYDSVAIHDEAGLPPEIDLPEHFIVAAGRLVAAKNFAMMIDAYVDARPPWPLLILGEGEERAALERRITERGLEGRVRLCGFLRNPFAIIGRAEYFVSASRNEGFPNAIAEAMVLGVPVLATDCPSGPAELLGSGSGAAGTATLAPHGIITPDGDEQALVAGLRLMDDPDVRARYRQAGRERMRDFRIETIAEQYWALFDSL